MSSNLLCKLVLEEMQFGPIRRPPIVGRKDGGLKLRLGGRREEGEEGKGGEGGRRKVMEYFKIDRRGGRRPTEERTKWSDALFSYAAAAAAAATQNI